MEINGQLKEFLSLKEIAQRYPLSLKWWYKHIGEIPHRKVGKILLFRPDEVRAFFDSRLAK